MHRNWMKGILILAVLLISMVSLSMATISTTACPVAKPNLYSTIQCGSVLSVPAPGFLANDVKAAGKTLTVASFRMDPKFGTLEVHPDGSFTYVPAMGSAGSYTAVFYYRATDGNCVSGETYVKIPVGCKCSARAPEIKLCAPTLIDDAFLVSEGAGCVGCGDVTPKFDLSEIPAPEEQVAGECYPYTVSCPGCNLITGHVCILEPCVVGCDAYTICPNVVPTAQDILVNGRVTCTCDSTPTITNIRMVNGRWEYDITCESPCGPVTQPGCGVDIEPPCVITSEPFTVCPDVTPTVADILAKANVICDCDETPVISDIKVVDDHWEYTITCTSAIGCETTATGRVNIEPPCVISAETFTVCPIVPPTMADILAHVDCDCDETPEISDIKMVDDHWEYTVTCKSAIGCTTTATGIVNIEPPCEISAVGFEYPCNAIPTAAEIIALGFVSCGDCDGTPLITNVHMVEQVGEDQMWAYTITCTSEIDCVTTAEGIFTRTPCQVPCDCEVRAPNFCICRYEPVPLDSYFLENGAGCDCDVTPIIDTSQVSTRFYGTYPYTVTCKMPGCEPVTKTGYICVQNPEDCGGCPPTNIPTSCNCPSPS